MSSIPLPKRHNFPKFHHLKIHATYLAKTLPVTYTQAQDILAYLYTCRNWADLKRQAQNAYPQLDGRQVDNVEIEWHRNRISDLLVENRGSVISKLQRLPLIPFTVSYEIFHLRTDWLMDEEIFALSGAIFEDDEEAIQDVYDAIMLCDNNIFSHMRYGQEKGLCSRSGWLNDYRMGFNLYYHAFLSERSVRLVIRELDSLIAPTAVKAGAKSPSSKRWYKNRVIGYVEHLMTTLGSGFESGSIVLQRIDNLDVVTQDLFFEELKLRGITDESLFGDQSTRTGIELKF